VTKSSKTIKPTDKQIEDAMKNVPYEEKDQLSREWFDKPYHKLDEDEAEDFDAALFDHLHDKLIYEKNIEGITEGPHGTTVHITPEMKEAYKKIKQEKGAVFPGYKKGGTVQKALDIVRRGDAR
jgi:hypothetical protein